MKDLFDSIPNENGKSAGRTEDLKKAQNDGINDSMSKYDEILDIIQNMSGAAEKAKKEEDSEIDETDAFDGNEDIGEEENEPTQTESESDEISIDGEAEATGGEEEKNAESEVFVPKVSIGKITDKIKKSRLLDKDSLKDMFFGSQNDAVDNYAFEEDESDYGADGEEAEPVLFDKNRKKRITADPENDKVIFSFEYMITPDQASDGYMLFYSEFIRRRNMGWTVFLLLLSAGLLISLVFSPTNYIRWLLLLICLSVTAMMWITAYNARRDAGNSADAVKNDSYKLTFYNSRIVINASELAGDRIYHYQPVMIRFEDINLRVIDYEDIYVLVFKKDYIYTVPKDAMTEQMNRIFKNHLSNILGDDYREYYVKHTNKPSDGEEASVDETETERE